MMDDLLKEKDKIREEFTELLETYYKGSFSKMMCDYFRSTGMTLQEVEELLKAMKTEVDAR